jgi:hypothetical protein
LGATPLVNAGGDGVVQLAVGALDPEHGRDDLQVCRQDGTRQDSAVKTAVIKAGKVVKVVSKAAGLPRAAAEAAVGVRVRTGQLRSCARFGGTIVKDAVGKFLAKNAPATLSDCSDASLRGSPSGAFAE